MHFIRGREKNIYIPKSDKPDFMVGCKFQVEKFRSDGTITYKGPVFTNLTLNSGLDLLASYTLDASTVYCNVGTGTSTPVETQTGLDSFRAASSTLYTALSMVFNATPPTYFSQKRTFSFAIGTVTGNLTEVGLSRVSNSNYFNRQLFKDGGGNPVAITVLADEGMRVTAETFCYAGMETADSVNGSFLMNGVTNIDFIKKINIPSASLGFLLNAANSLCDAGAIGSMSGVITAEISGTSTGFPDGTNASSAAVASYVAGSFERSCTYKWLAGIGTGMMMTVLSNIGNSSSVGNRLHAFYLTPGINKLAVEELTITLRRSWGRYVAP